MERKRRRNIRTIHDELSFSLLTTLNTRWAKSAWINHLGWLLAKIKMQPGKTQKKENRRAETFSSETLRNGL